MKKFIHFRVIFIDMIEEINIGLLEILQDYGGIE